MGKHITRSLCFLLPLLLAAILLGLLFRPKNNTASGGMLETDPLAVSSQPENSLDVLFLGDSEAYSGFVPMALWKDTGIASFVCASVDQKPYETEDFLREALKNQSPKVVVLETVILLSQQKPDDTIEIDLDLDELDATSAELKATYQEIKDYVLKEFGLKVSNLYISQVKRKCGIEVGENYNLPKSENARVPQCPKEKEDAIKAALKYFAMI